MTVMVVAEVEVPAQGAMPTVHSTQEVRAAGWGEHQHSVPVSPQPLLSDSPQGPRHSPGQELCGGKHPDLLRLLLPQAYLKSGW